MIADVPTLEQRPYTPYGAAATLLYDRSPEIMVDGPAGTGKSRACLEKLHICAAKYPGMRALIARKTRKSLTESALVTYEQHVLPESSPIKAGPAREQRHVYRYPNGSEIICGGLDDTLKVMSSEYDMIYVQEARELTEDDWEHLGSRLRNGRMPYQQIVGDTNPDAPRHWIKQRATRGPLRLIQSRHADNPTLTPEYMARLAALTGIRHKRLYDGLWVAAEGIVYDDYDPAIHLVDRHDVPAEWPRYLAVDFGYSNPFVCQWWAQDPDGRLYRYRELYQSQGLVEDHAHRIRGLSSGESIRAIVCDHDAEDRATLQRHLTCACPEVAGVSRIGCGTTGARKDVSPGLQAVSQRLRVAGDGKPRLLLLRDSLAGRDARLDEEHKPTCTEEEFESYVWDDATRKLNPDGMYKAEAPLKLNDHGLDALRYMVAYFDLGADTSKWLQPTKVDYGTPKEPLPSIVGLPAQFPARDKRDWSKFVRV